MVRTDKLLHVVCFLSAARPCARGFSPLIWWEIMRDALKVMRLYFFWPMTLEADVDGVAVEVEPSWQYSVTFWCHVTDGSRGAVWQEGIWHGIVGEAKVCHWIPPCRKNDILQYLLNVSRDQTVNVSMVMHTVMVCFRSGYSGSPLLVQIMCMACRLLFFTVRST